MKYSLSQFVRKKVEEGTYYTEAKNWYAKKYLGPVVERSYFLLLCLICIALMYVGIMNVKQIMDSKNEELDDYVTEIPIPLLTNFYTATKFPFIYRLSSFRDYEERLKTFPRGYPERPEEPIIPQKAVAEFLIARYVLTRETFNSNTYSADQFKKIDRLVKTNSSKNVYTRYKTYMNRRNKNSPFIRYGKRVKREIDIIDIQFLDDEYYKGVAKVRYTAKESLRTNPTQQCRISVWDSIVRFNLSSVETIHITGSPLRYEVSEYNPILLKKTHDSLEKADTESKACLN